MKARRTIYFLCAVLTACASNDPPDTDSESEAITADWIHPACTADALMPPAAGSCNGPWTYSYAELTTDASVCGHGACTTNATCTSWDVNSAGDGWGVFFTNGTEYPASRYTTSCVRSCTGHTCRTTCTGTLPAQIGPICTTAANQRRAAIVASLAPNAPAWAVNSLTVSGVPYVADSAPPDGEGFSYTTYGCQLTVTNVPNQSSGAFPVCGCAAYQPITCTRFSNSATTPPGQPRPTAGAPTIPGDWRTLVGEPVCTTCDATAFGTDIDAQTKFECLSQQRTTASGDLASSLAARMELLLHAAAEHLTPSQRALAESMYATAPDASPACRAPIAWEPSCEVPATGTLQLCTDLATDPIASPGAAALELAACTTQLSQLATQPATCRLAMRDPANATVQTVLEHAQPTFGGDFATALPLALARIGDWWTAANLLAAGDHDWFLARSGALLRWLWTTVEAERMPLPAGHVATDAAAAALLADVTSTRFANDIAVLSFAFAPGQTGSAPPLLALTSDALQGLADRLVRLEPIHDVGCRFAACKTNTALRSSATSELVHVLASLTDHTELVAAIAAATHLNQQQPVLYAALGAIRDQHAYLVSAWNRLGRPETFDALATITDPPAEAASLAAIVRAAKVAWGSYQASGTFAPWNGSRLTAGTLRQNELVGFVDTLATTTHAAQTAFTGARLATVNDLLDQSVEGGAIQNETDRWNELKARVVDLVQRSDALDQRDASERTAIASYQTSFEAVVNSGVLDVNAAYQTEQLPIISASAADAHYPTGASPDVIRDHFEVLTLKAGETLHFHITGHWAPDCSVSTSQITGPWAPIDAPIDMDQALIGPEGYLVSWQDTHYRAIGRNHEDGSGSTTSLDVQACIASPLPFLPAHACVAHNENNFNKNTNVDNSGDDTRVSASFVTGVRLPSTPYRDAPAGALLAVVTHAGSHGGFDDRPLDVRVIERDDVLVGPDPGMGADHVDVHLVVNDRGLPPSGVLCPQDPSALQIQIVKATPVGTVAKQVGAASALTLAAIEAEATTVLAQGELGPFEATALRADAWARLQTALQPSGIGTGGLPYELRQLFEGTLERELASLSRRGEKAALVRDTRQLALAMDTITHEQEFSEDQDRLRHLIPRWRLRDLSGIELASSIGALAEGLAAYVAPIYELRDPAALTSFRTQVATQLSQIIDLQITAPYEDTVANFLSFATAARNALAAAQFELPTDQRRTVIVAVPRPGMSWTGPWRKVSETEAKAFWESTRDADSHLRADATITLRPEDLYSGPGGSSQLSCQDLAPVVRHVGLFFDSGDDVATLGPAGTELAGTAASTAGIRFPTVGQQISFLSTDPLGIPLSYPAFNGGAFDVLGIPGTGILNFGAWPADLGAGAGISPFTSFRIDMRAFATAPAAAVLDHTKAMFLVFEVERRTSNPFAFVPGVCQLATP